MTGPESRASSVLAVAAGSSVTPVTCSGESHTSQPSHSGSLVVAKTLICLFFKEFFLALREMRGKIDNSICATSSLLECLGPLTHPVLAWNNIIYISHSNSIPTFHKSFDYRCLSRPIKKVRDLSFNWLHSNGCNKAESVSAYFVFYILHTFISVGKLLTT